MHKRLQGKIALITGAAGGMGQVASKRFCEEGATVVGTDQNRDLGLELERGLLSSGLNFSFVEADITSTEAISDLKAAFLAKHGKLDILYNNAGIIRGSPLLSTSDEDWDLVHDVNLKSTFRMIRAFAPLMEQGSIVNVSSTGGVVAVQGMSAYGSSKAGLLQLTRVAALELAPNIRVNCICPAVTDTGMPREFISNFEGPDAIWQSFNDVAMVKRVATPEEVVAVALFLASDESSYVSAAVIPVDSGSTAI